MANSRLHGARDLRGNMILKLEYVGDDAIVALRPQLLAGLSVYQLDGNAKAIAISSHGTLDDIAGTEILVDFASIDRPALVGEGRLASNHAEVPHARQRGGYLLHQPIHQVIIAWSTEVIERHNNNGRLPTVTADCRPSLGRSAAGHGSV